MKNMKIIDVTKNTITTYPPRCFLKPDNPGQIAKNQWVMDRFSEGVKIKLLFVDNKLAGYIEYIPGKNAWRAVDAKDFLFIHCIWMYPNKNKDKGYGSILINESLKDAEILEYGGVAVISSDESFMASKDVFEKNEFEVVQEDNPYQLLVKKRKEVAHPRFQPYKDALEGYSGLHIVYSEQCPWVNRFMYEMKNKISENNIKITKLKTAQEAQMGPSIYASFSFIHDGTLLVDHYISQRRFENILKKL